MCQADNSITETNENYDLLILIATQLRVATFSDKSFKELLRSNSNRDVNIERIRITVSKHINRTS